MSDDSMVGKVIQGRYEVTGILGQGGMGAVYRAEQTAMGRQVALKMLRHEFGQDEQLSERFVREARNSARLEHPNTVRVFDFGKTDDGDLFLVMELLSGGELADVIGNGMPPIKAIHITRQVARSVAEAHNKGLVHRDLKPGNINVQSVEGDDSFVKVLDFGLAKLTQTEDGGEKDQSLTSAGAALGTPLYMSPEQCAGVKVDNRCDIYALGCILFELLTGQPPFVGASAVMTMTMHIRDEMPELTKTRPDRVFPPMLEQIIRKCMKKEADERFQKMEEVVTALDLAQQSMSSTTGAQSLPHMQANSAEMAMDATVAPSSGVDLAQAVSAELSSPQRMGLNQAMASDPGLSNQAIQMASQPRFGPPSGPQMVQGVSASFVHSNVAGELIASQYPPGAPAKSGVGKMVAAAAVLLVGGGGAFFALNQGGKDAPAQQSPAKAADKPAPKAAPAVAPAPAPAAPAAEAKVYVEIKGTKGAKIFFDEVEVGTIPKVKKFPEGNDRMQVDVTKRGYEPFTQVVKRKDHVDGELLLDVTLTKKKRKKAKKSYDMDDGDAENDYEL